MEVDMYLKNIAFYLFTLIIATSLLGYAKNDNKNIKKSVNKEIKKDSKTSEFYKFKAKDIYGKELSLEEYKGKVILVVNVASKCGYTYQYKGLEKLYKEYKDKGLVILGFPSNQFAQQEPGTNEEIASFCKVNFGVTFPLFTKIKVNGKDAHPLYKYLKSKKVGLSTKRIGWNFTKFLIDSNGKAIKRYPSKVKPKNIEKDIKNLLIKHK